MAHIRTISTCKGFYINHYIHNREAYTDCVQGQIMSTTHNEMPEQEVQERIDHILRCDLSSLTRETRVELIKELNQLLGEHPRPSETK